MRPAVLISVLVIGTACADTQPAPLADAACRYEPFVAVHPGGEFGMSRDSAEFSLGGVRYRVRHDGSGLRLTKPDPTVFHIPLPDTGLRMESLWAGSYNCDVIVVSQYSDGDGAASQASRRSAESLQTRWVARQLGLNAAPPLADGSYLYLAARGSVAKLDLATGAFAWRHDSIYDRASGAFNIFAQPTKVADTVFFTSRDGHGRPRVIAVDDSTGVILSP